MTKLEVMSEDHSETLDEHQERHETQDTWNKAFTVALAGLAAGVAHTKAGDWISLVQSLLGLLSK